MGFWKKLFGGSNQPDKDESVGVDPTTDEKMKPKHKKADVSHSEGPKYTGRTEDTKAQRQTDPETREIIKDAEVYPNEAETQGTTEPRGDVDASQAVGQTKPKKSKAEQRKTQPKPGAKQKTTPKEAEPGSGKTKAGQHKEKD